MAASGVKLASVSRSPATLQYMLPKPTATGRPLYKRRFYPNEEAKESLSQPWLARTDPMMPPYPYGKNHHFEEANHGLYGGATIQSGNKISDGRNKGRTLRKWYPNVRVEKLKSKALNVELSIPTVARVMRTIQKSGGLDEYLLGEKPARIKELGLLGWKLRWLIMKSNTVKGRYTQERLKLGVPSTLDLDTQFAEVWADTEMRKSLIEKMHAGWQQLREKDQKFMDHWTAQGKRARTMKVLEMYDPKELSLPQEVEEEFVELPQVQTGFGIIDAPAKKPTSNVTLSGPPGHPVNKAPGKSNEVYEGGANSAVRSGHAWETKAAARAENTVIPKPNLLNTAPRLKLNAAGRAAANPKRKLFNTVLRLKPNATGDVLAEPRKKPHTALHPEVDAAGKAASRPKKKLFSTVRRLKLKESDN